MGDSCRLGRIHLASPSCPYYTPHGKPVWYEEARTSARKFVTLVVQIVGFVPRDLREPFSPRGRNGTGGTSCSYTDIRIDTSWPSATGTEGLETMAMQTDARLAREFRDWFREQLHERQLTQAEAAAELGTHPSTVVKWCSKNPPLPSYVQLVVIVSKFQGLPPSLAPLHLSGISGGTGV